jgi:hypothetical protein
LTKPGTGYAMTLSEALKPTRNGAITIQAIGHRPADDSVAAINPFDWMRSVLDEFCATHG